VADELVVELRFAAQADRLKLLRSVVRDATEWIGFTAETANNIVLAVNEACMNVMQHAYCNDPAGEIRLYILKRDNALVFRLQDFAPPIDKQSVCARALDDIRPGGLGVHFIHEIMDVADFVEPPDQVGNLFEMTKYLES
jgi:anti-sigma regulatory factor (Ser/Thr protein kinase)